MTFNTAAKVPSNSTGVIPPAPPTQFQRGNTLFVSKTGDDATAARQDGIYVYDTIEGALAALSGGDCIIVYPGDYTLSAPLEISTDETNIYFYPGVKIFATDFNAFNLSANNIFISGDAEINIDGSNTFCYAVYNTGSNNYFEANILNVSKQYALGFVFISGSLNGIIKNKIYLTDNAQAILSVQGKNNLFVNEISGTFADDTQYAPVIINSSVADPGLGYANVFNLKFNTISVYCPIEALNVTIGSPGGIGDEITLTGNVIKNTYNGAGSSVSDYFGDVARPRKGDAILIDTDSNNPVKGFLIVNSKLSSISGAGIYRYNISGVILSNAEVNAIFNTDIDAYAAFLLYAHSASKMIVNGVWRQRSSSEFGYSNNNSQVFFINLNGRLDSYLAGAVTPILIYNPSNDTNYPVVVFNAVIVSANAVKSIESASANAINITVYNLFTTAPLDVNITELVSNSITDVNVV